MKRTFPFTFDMAPPARIQVHILRVFGASSSNRDDQNRPKQMQFGGVTRHRISSQSCKSAWRSGEQFARFEKWAHEMFNCNPMVRTRLLYPWAQEQLMALGMPLDKACEAAKALVDSFSNEDTKRAKKDRLERKSKRTQESPGGSAEPASGSIDKSLETQLLVLSESEVINLCSELLAWPDKSDEEWAEKAVKSLAKKIEGGRKKAMLPLNSPLAALFGRMMSSQICANLDSPVQVGHAFSVHEGETDVDFFTGSDDLVRLQGKRASAILEQASFASGVFYQYGALDADLLYENLRRTHPALTEEDVRLLTHVLIHSWLIAFAESVPRGRQASMASDSRPLLMAVDVGNGLGSAESAFDAPVVATPSSGHALPALERFDKFIQARSATWSRGDNTLRILREGDPQMPFTRLVDESCEQVMALIGKKSVDRLLSLGALVKRSTSTSQQTGLGAPTLPSQPGPAVDPTLPGASAVNAPKRKKRTKEAA